MNFYIKGFFFFLLLIPKRKKKKQKKKQKKESMKTTKILLLQFSKMLTAALIECKTNWIEKMDCDDWSVTMTRLLNLLFSSNLWLFVTDDLSLMLFLVIKHLVCIIKGSWENVISQTCRKEMANLLHDRNVAPDHIPSRRKTLFTDSGGTIPTVNCSIPWRPSLSLPLVADLF